MRKFIMSLWALSLAVSASAESFRQPSVIEWGASAARLQRELAAQCSHLATRKVDPPFLPDVRTEQLQMDCEGFNFAGRNRHVEFVIRDDRLVMVWLMVEATEEPAILAKMKAALGAPTGENTNYVAFEHDRIAWRRKPAEILFYAPELDKDMAPDFR